MSKKNQIKYWLLNNIPIVCVSLMMVIVCISIGVSHFINPVEQDSEIMQLTNQKQLEQQDSPIKSVEEVQSKESTNKQVMVEVKGAVTHPKVYELSSGDRVDDVLKLAKPTQHADLAKVNMAKELHDEMVIYIPDQRQRDDSIEKFYSKNNNHSKENSAQNMDQQCININNASTDDLQTIPGIGPKRALDISNYRSEQPFDTIDEIKNVSGIGDKTFDTMKSYICV